MLINLLICSSFMYCYCCLFLYNCSIYSDYLKMMKISVHTSYAKYTCLCVGVWEWGQAWSEAWCSIVSTPINPAKKCPSILIFVSKALPLPSWKLSWEVTNFNFRFFQKWWHLMICQIQLVPSSGQFSKGSSCCLQSHFNFSMSWHLTQQT